MDFYYSTIMTSHGFLAILGYALLLGFRFSAASCKNGPFLGQNGVSYLVSKWLNMAKRFVDSLLLG
jgi:hypothetical protein